MQKFTDNHTFSHDSMSSVEIFIQLRPNPDIQTYGYSFVRCGWFAVLLSIFFFLLLLQTVKIQIHLSVCLCKNVKITVEPYLSLAVSRQLSHSLLASNVTCRGFRLSVQKKTSAVWREEASDPIKLYLGAALTSDKK